MKDYALSSLEIQNLIERALLPDICLCDCKGDFLTVTLTRVGDPNTSVSLGNISMQSLQSSRSIAYLVGELRYLISLSENPARQSADRRVGRA